MGYVNQIKAARARQNNLNKARSRAMEARVAKRLGGTRVPMSGAGSFKGDGVAHSSIGMYLVECKFSSQTYNKEGPSIRFAYKYVPKLDDEVTAMKAKFGIFAIQFYQHAQVYVIMREEYFRLLDPAEVGYNVHDDKSGYVMTKQRLTKHLTFANPYRVISTYTGPLFVMTIERFIQALEASKNRVKDMPEDKDTAV